MPTMTLTPSQKIAQKANQESRSLENMMLFVFQIQVESVCFDGDHFLTGRGLRLGLSAGGPKRAQFLYTDPVKAVKVTGEGSSQSILNYKEMANVAWEGVEKMDISLFQSNLLFPATLLGSVQVSLPEFYTQLVSNSRSCNTAQAEALPIELEVKCGSGADQAYGRLRITVSCSKRSLGALGGPKILKLTEPDKFRPGHDVHSDAIKSKLKEIHNAKSLFAKLNQAQAALWMAGVQRLTDDGALDSASLQRAAGLGFMSATRTQMLKQMFNQQLRRSSTDEVALPTGAAEQLAVDTGFAVRATSV
eukprot:gb/GFBE01062562.1/.p1 GENE.gb/GFBE01062562.1/~~gb/GFBE01062562.1/.p1  ORF type:complete len:305 (+),score=59.53 gb/GFBE01062562.1/:1-915(+)